VVRAVGGSQRSHPWFVLRAADPRGIDREASGLGVFPKRVVESGLGVIRLIHDHLQIIRNNHLEDTLEERQAASNPAITSSTVWRWVG